MKVLVVGASMAGLSAAYWFGRTGAEVTVVEICNGLRRGGAPIDIRGKALDTAAKMGILDEVRRQKVRYTGAGSIIDVAGNDVATIDLTWFANETDDDVEITRDRLNNLLFAVAKPLADWRFETSIDSIDDDGDGVDVTFSDSSHDRYDMVVGADGLHSTVRRLVFGPEEDYLKHMGHYVALADLDTGKDWNQAMFNDPGLMATVRPVDDASMAYVLIRSEPVEYDYMDAAQQRGMVKDFLQRGDVWELPRLRSAFEDPDQTSGFYFDSMCQTVMPSWTKGRVAVIGDAGHSSSLLSGMGTSLAMTAAEYLATEVAATPDDLSAAFSRFEARQRPLVDKAQESVEGNAFMMVPGTTDELERRNALLRDLARQHG